MFTAEITYSMENERAWILVGLSQVRRELLRSGNYYPVLSCLERHDRGIG